jgi:hypothetical protein
MICQRCGAVNNGGDQFCGTCGAVLVSSHPQANKAPALPTSYGSSMDAPTIAEPLFSAQQPYSAAPTQYVPPQNSPGNGWATPPGNYAPPPQATWADAPLVHQSPALPPPTAQPAPGRQRRRRWPWYLLLFLMIFGLVVSASWIFLLRPAVHRSVDGQIRQGLQQAVNQIPLLPPNVPSGVPFPVTDEQINDYLAQNVSQLAPITDMHVSLQPDVMVVTFQAYGFGSTIDLGLAVKDGTLVAQNVSVSGLLWWVESADDLTARFDEALGQIPDKLGHQVSAVSIQDGEIDFTFA